jgi:hypothetical protein
MYICCIHIEHLLAFGAMPGEWMTVLFALQRVIAILAL